MLLLRPVYRENTMTLHQTNIESLPFVTAELNYLAPTNGKPRTYAFDPPPGEPKSTALPEPHDVPIFDGRSIAKVLQLFDTRLRSGISTTITRSGKSITQPSNPFCAPR